MFLQTPDNNRVHVTDRALQCEIFKAIIYRLHETAVHVVTEGKINLEYTGFKGTLEGKKVILEPATDLLLLFAALKHNGGIVGTNVCGVRIDIPEEEQQAMERVFKMVRDEAKGYLDADVYRGLQTFLVKARRDSKTLSDIYPRLCVMLGCK